MEGRGEPGGRGGGGAQRVHIGKNGQKGSFLVAMFLFDIDAPMVFITSGGNFRVSSPTWDPFGPTLKSLKASNLSFFWAGLGLL